MWLSMLEVLHAQQSQNGNLFSPYYLVCQYTYMYMYEHICINMRVYIFIIAYGVYLVCQYTCMYIYKYIYINMRV